MLQHPSQQLIACVLDSWTLEIQTAHPGETPVELSARNDPGTDRHPSSNDHSPSVSRSSGLTRHLGPSPTSKTTTLREIPICGAASPTPGASYMVSSMSATRRWTVWSISTTGSAWARSTGSPNVRIGNIATPTSGMGSLGLSLRVTPFSGAPAPITSREDPHRYGRPHRSHADAARPVAAWFAPATGRSPGSTSASHEMPVPARTPWHRSQPLP